MFINYPDWVKLNCITIDKLKELIMSIKDRYELYINGQWVKPQSGEYLDAINPANGEKISEFAAANNKDVDKAIEAARSCFEGEYGSWSKEERADLLSKIADRIEENIDYLAKIESMDNGKAIRETKLVDLPWVVEHFRYFSSLIRTDEGEISKLQGRFISIRKREPLGVVAQMIPWNFPLLMAAWKLAPAIAGGNTIVISPSSNTSIGLLEMIRLIDDLLPKGLINVVSGKGSITGEYLQHHLGLDKLAFTGSTSVGRHIGVSAAENLIPSTLELGGKSAHIIFDDCDQEKALEGAQVGILFNQGEVCSAGSRLFIQESIYDEFVEKLVKAFEKVKVGDPLDPTTQMGALRDEKRIPVIQSFVDEAVAAGGKILTGGKRLTENGLDKGAFYAPTILADVPEDNNAYREEIFGPVLVINKFKDEDDVIRMANDSHYGLGGGIYSNDMYRIMKVTNSLQTGRIWVNTYNQFPAGAPFGGYKDSGIGRETDKLALDAYSQVKNIIIDSSKDKLGFY